MRLINDKKVVWNLIQFSKKSQKSTMACSSENLYNKIDTFVFFDLETTDLIRGSKMPKITELAMVATNRNSIICDRRNKLALPRIMHKLSIPICPNRPIEPQASFCSNLWNDALENIKPFDENTYDMIMQFIDRLPGNICFVAHNGNRFDYPIFLWEIEQLQKTFPDKILCVDSLHAFKEFYSEIEPITLSHTEMIPEGRDEVDEELENFKNKKFDMPLDDDWNNALCSVLDNFEKVKTRENYQILNCDAGTDVLDAVTNKGKESSEKLNLSPKSLQAKNEKTPENQIIRNPTTSNTSKILNNARRNLNFSDIGPKNFKLGTIYMHMIGLDPENQHRAEDDCINMLRCICQLGPYFGEWADQNAVSLNLFKKSI